jgi:hypothetical protein
MVNGHNADDKPITIHSNEEALKILKEKPKAGLLIEVGVNAQKKMKALSKLLETSQGQDLILEFCEEKDNRETLKKMLTSPTGGALLIPKYLEFFAQLSDEQQDLEPTITKGLNLTSSGREGFKTANRINTSSENTLSF